MVPIASYYMEGEMLKWFQGVEASSLYTNWVDFICTHNISFEHQSFLHQWRLPPKNLNAKACELHDGEPRTNPAPTQESTIQELEIQVSLIQESKMQELIIQMVQESHEVLRIQRQSKVQIINENSKTI